MRVLFLATWSGGWPYIQEMSLELRKRGIQCDFFDAATRRIVSGEYRGGHFLSRASRLPFRIPVFGSWLRAKLVRSGLSHVIGAYDVINIHFVAPEYDNLVPLMRERAIRVVASVWGSDFLRMDNAARERQRSIYEIADLITFNNPSVLESFAEYYVEHSGKCRVIRFGLGSLRTIDRIMDAETRRESAEKLRVPAGKLIVAVGYNAVSAQQHSFIIHALSALTSNEKERICLVLPLTYPDDGKYKAETADLAVKAGFETVVFDRKLDGEDLARLRIVSDIVLNFQKTDSLSASIQEHAYCGARFVVGSWLPYAVLEDIGIKFEKASTAEELVEKFRASGLSEDPDEAAVARHESRKELIRSFSSWESNAEKWIKAYADIIGE